jgi:hypothetical protein
MRGYVLIEEFINKTMAESAASVNEILDFLHHQEDIFAITTTDKSLCHAAAAQELE